MKCPYCKGKGYHPGFDDSPGDSRIIFCSYCSATGIYTGKVEMEIIKRGTLRSEYTYTVTCRECGTVYRFKRSEARFHSDQRDGDALATDCPVCDRTVWTSVKKHD